MGSGELLLAHLGNSATLQVRHALVEDLNSRKFHPVMVHFGLLETSLAEAGKCPKRQMLGYLFVLDSHSIDVRKSYPPKASFVPNQLEFQKWVIFEAIGPCFKDYFLLDYWISGHQIMDYLLTRVLELMVSNLNNYQLLGLWTKIRVSSSTKFRRRVFIFQNHPLLAAFETTIDPFPCPRLSGLRKPSFEIYMISKNLSSDF